MELHKRLLMKKILKKEILASESGTCLQNPSPLHRYILNKNRFPMLLSFVQLASLFRCANIFRQATSNTWAVTMSRHEFHCGVWAVDVYVNFDPNHSPSLFSPSGLWRNVIADGFSFIFASSSLGSPRASRVPHFKLSVPPLTTFPFPPVASQIMLSTVWWIISLDRG